MALNDETQHITFLNPAFVRTFGYTESDIPTLKDWWPRAYPDPEYRQWVTDTWEAEIERAKRTGEAFTPLESRVTCKDGTTKTAIISASLLTGAFEGSHLVTLYDVTDRKRAEEALRESEERYRTVADFTYDWEAWMAPDGTYRYVSPSCERITGHTAAEFTADSGLLMRIVHPDDHSLVVEHYRASRDEGQEQDLKIEFRIVTPDGETRWIGHSCTPVHGEGGHWLGRRESNRDITELKLTEEALRRQATTDELTGAANRRRFFELARGELKRAARHQEPVAVAFVDVDDLKRVNDTSGHAAGDQALRAFVDTCRRCIREIDVLARMGGDEFALLLPETTLDQAYATVERVRVALEGRTTDLVGDPLSITVSAGVVGVLGDAETLESLLKRADQALYRAKNSGRNRTVAGSAAGMIRGPEPPAKPRAARRF